MMFVSFCGIAISMNLVSAYTEYIEDEDFQSQTATWGMPPNHKYFFYDYTHEIEFRNSFNGWYLYDAEICPTLDITNQGVTITDTYSAADEDETHDCWAKTSVTGTYSGIEKTEKVKDWYEDWYPLGYPWNGDWNYQYFL